MNPKHDPQKCRNCRFLALFGDAPFVADLGETLETLLQFSEQLKSHVREMREGGKEGLILSIDAASAEDLLVTLRNATAAVNAEMNHAEHERVTPPPPQRVIVH